MRHFSDAYAALRRKNRGQYALLAGCSFFSVLLITAYVCMMRSPTILSVLPEGGDSRKQVMMVFVLAVIGCAVFTAYAAGLFFRQKSRETGVFLALGATRRQLQREMGKELAVISLGSCAAGAVDRDAVMLLFHVGSCSPIQILRNIILENKILVNFKLCRIPC